MKLQKHSLLVILTFLAITSCQVGHEIHYFKEGKNYYRITIHESSFASKSRYMSGFYDEAALDKYFGEMSQPVESDSTKAADVSFYNPTNGDRLQIDSNKRFVMILSTNNNVVSNQISAFADNEQILESIARLSKKSKIEESNKYVADAAASYKRNKSVTDLGDQFISGIDSLASVSKVKGNIAIFLQYLKDQGISNTTSTEILLKTFQK